jgi:hypothetical protein
MTREAVIKRPEVHGFGGGEVIDQPRIAEVVEQANNALRMLHVHGLGLGVLILLISIAIVNLPLAEGVKKALCVVVSLGALYPPGWLTLGWLIPYWGVKALRSLSGAAAELCEHKWLKKACLGVRTARA